MSIPTTPAEFLATIPQTTQDPCEAMSNALLAYPQLVYEFMKWAIKDDGSNFTPALIGHIYDVGDYKYSVVSNLDTGNPTSRWLLCNGAQRSATDYPALAAILGTGAGSLFGAASAGNFMLPNLQGKFPLAVSGGHAIGTTGGVETVTLTEAQVPTHTHTIQIPGDTAVDNLFPYTLAQQGDGTNLQTYTTTPFGGGGSHTNMPPYVTAGYVYIKT